MIPIPILGIPHLNRGDLLVRLLNSIDYPVSKVVIVQNGSDQQMPALGQVRQNPNIHAIDIVRHPNAGVAGSWNEIVKLYPAAWWMISNNDIQFAPGDLKKMIECVVENFKTHGVFWGHAASWFAVTDKCIDTVGLWDENIYPAYLEDCDFDYRCRLLNVQRMNVPGTQAVHGEGKMTGSCTINSDPVLSEKNIQTHSRNHGYYEAKWGGKNEEEVFKTPFNDPTWPVWAWKFYPGFRKEQQW